MEYNKPNSLKLFGGISALIALSYSIIKIKRNKTSMSNIFKSLFHCHNDDVNLLEVLPKSTNQKIIMLNYSSPSPFLSSYIKYFPTDLYSLTGPNDEINQMIKSIGELYKVKSIQTSPSSLFNAKNENSNLLINSYGEVKIISSEELNEVIASKNKIPFLERLNILSSIERLFLLNTYDCILLYNSNKEAIDYYNQAFKLFHSLSQSQARFNLFAYVKIPKYPIPQLPQLKDDHIYLIKVKRKINESYKSAIHIKVDYDEFFAFDLGIPEDLNSLNSNNKDNANDYNEELLQSLIHKQLFQHCSFHYYLHSNVKDKEAIEGLNYHFKNEPYIAIFCNLITDKHKKQLETALTYIKKNYDNLPKQTSIIVIDHYSNENDDINIIQVFKDKYFDLRQYTLKDTIFDPKKIQYYEPVVLKKLFIDINSIKSHQWKKDVNFEDNSLFVAY